MKQILLIVILTILLGGSLYIVKNKSLSTDNIEISKTKDKYDLLGSIENKNISIYGKKTDSGYSSIIIEAGKRISCNC
jgi:uncharacterized protein YxeA